MAGFSPQQQAFISTLAGRTGLNPGVVAAWVAAEEPVGASSGYHGTQDWLNVGITDSGPMGQNNAVWRDPTQAAIATANWIKGTWSDPGFGHAAPGIVKIAGTAGQSPQAQIAAIQNSGWASGGYSDLPQLYSTYAGQAPKPSGGGVPGMSTPSTTPPGSPMGFDQAGFQKAQRAYTAGSFVSQLGKSNPYEIPVKGAVSFSNPLLTSGLLTTTPPNPADFQTAQTTLQKIAGNAPLSVHPAASASRQAGLVNPLAGFSGLSFDKGIDGSAPAGTPIRAPAGSTLVDVIPDFYKGQPLLLFKFDQPIPGAPSQYWFTSEQINPATRTIGTHFQAGQAVATFASSGTGMETGWGSPSTNDRRFAPVEAHYGQAHTGWGYNFARFFGIA